MPYYIGDFHNPSYRNYKRIYSLSELNKSGFLNHLLKLEKAKTIIIFGSFTRSDWYENSDIDIFIYGSDEKLEKYKYQSKLRREIQVFTAKDKEDLKKFRPGLLRSIVQGYLVKGVFDFLNVEASA